MCNSIFVFHKTLKHEKNLLGILCLTLSILAISCKKIQLKLLRKKSSYNTSPALITSQISLLYLMGCCCSGIQHIFQIT